MFYIVAFQGIKKFQLRLLYLKLYLFHFKNKANHLLAYIYIVKVENYYSSEDSSIV